jgi:HrpA-like RNA helicase
MLPIQSTQTNKPMTVLPQLIAAVVSHVIDTANKPGGILIFLPGVQEIRQCIEALRNIPHSNSADILPLHANLSNEEQQLVFASSARWKIITATNVAEVSWIQLCLVGKSLL